MRFTIGHLFIAVTVAAILTGTCVLVRNHLDRIDGHGLFESYQKWPLALKALVDAKPELREDVEPYGLMQFIDHKSIWLIAPGSELRNLLDDQHELELVGPNHPMANKLVESIPAHWKAAIPKNCHWHATPGYGSIHIEGLDLFLIVDNLDTGESIVLHEWIF